MYVCNTVHVPNLLTSNNVGSTINSQTAVNEEDIVTKGDTDLIPGPSHFVSHHTGVDGLGKCLVFIVIVTVDTN